MTSQESIPAPIRRPTIIIVDGLIGSGKTVLCQKLGHHLTTVYDLDVCTILEPVDMWHDILKLFYQDPKRWGYSFQTFAFATRVQRICQAFETHSSADVYILERSPATDRIFMSILAKDLDPMENHMYETWCTVYEKLLPFNIRDTERVCVLYLQTSLDMCMKRVSLRHRDGEIADEEESSLTTSDATAKSESHASAQGGVSREYQRLLFEAHERFFNEGLLFDPRNIIRVSEKYADLNFKEPGPEQDECLTFIISRLQNLETLQGFAEMTMCHSLCSCSWRDRPST